MERKTKERNKNGAKSVIERDKGGIKMEREEGRKERQGKKTYERKREKGGGGTDMNGGEEEGERKKGRKGGREKKGRKETWSKRGTIYKVYK